MHYTVVAHLTMYALYTLFQLYVNDRLNVSYSRVLKFFLQAGLLFISLVCGILRIYDNKHHLSDVIAGFGIGITMAVAVVSLYTIPYMFSNV